MDSNLTSFKRLSSERFEATFEGRYSTVGYRSANPTLLRELAANELRRAEDIAHRARLALAIADAVETEQSLAADMTAKQRRERSAATRAHNADPYGYDALAKRCAERDADMGR